MYSKVIHFLSDVLSYNIDTIASDHFTNEFSTL